MTAPGKSSLKIRFSVCAVFALSCILTLSAPAYGQKKGKNDSTLTTPTPKKKPAAHILNNGKPNSTDTTLKINLLDSTHRRGDSLTQPTTDTFSLKLSKDTLDAPVNYEAEDSAVVLVPQKKVILYGKTKTTYKDVLLTAPVVTLDQQTNTVTAVGNKDSLGETITRAKFEQKTDNFESDTIIYNFKTQKGLTKNTFTQQNEMYIQGNTIKKVDSVTVFIKGGRFTTCNLDEPHFAFRANKLKVINNKVAISGPMHPEFEGVPVPIYLPFGYYPLSQGRHSGLLPPQFAATENYGLGLEGLGYYKVLSQNLDATFRANIYSYGGWRGDLTTTYRKRYRYAGAFNFSLQNTKTNFKGDPDYSSVRTFFVTWSHSMDQRARPGISFSANVNAGSTKYNRYVTNSLERNFQNQLGSSINFSKTWIGKPFNLTLAANHNQNNATRLVNLMLPEAGFTVSTIYPFERKTVVGAAKWYEKIGIGYQGNMRNQLAFYDTAATFKHLMDTLQWGAQHSIPISMSLPPVGPVIISPNISYSQVWAMRKRIFNWNQVKQGLDTIDQRGFYTANNLSAGVQLSTNIFGTYQFKNSRVLAIRHTIRPSMGINYSPNLARGYYRSVQVLPDGTKATYNTLQNNLYTGYSNLEFGGMSFGVDNSLEMKVRSKKDTTGTPKKIRLIDGFGFNSSYNFLLDSLQLGDFNLYLRSTLFDKLNLNFNANLTPYEVDNFGRHVFVWNNKFRPGRITNGNLSLSTQFRSKPKDPSKKGISTTNIPQNPNRITDPTALADQQRLLDYMRRNPADFVDFNIPYDLSLDLAMGFSRVLQPDRTIKTTFNSSFNFHGSFSLTPKWNVSGTGYFNLDTKKLEAFSLGINREMHCWQMSISVSPIGIQRYFSISLSPKSSILQNLKINRTRVFSDF